MNIINHETQHRSIQMEAQALVKLANRLKVDLSIKTLEEIEKKVSEIVFNRQEGAFRKGLQLVQKSLIEIRGKLRELTLEEYRVLWRNFPPNKHSFKHTEKTGIWLDCVALRNRIIAAMQSVLPKLQPFRKAISDEINTYCRKLSVTSSQSHKYREMLTEFEGFTLFLNRPFLEQDNSEILIENCQITNRCQENALDIVKVLLRIFDVNATSSLARFVCNTCSVAGPQEKVKMMQLLIENGLDLDKALQSIVGAPGMDFPLEILQILIDQGATMTEEMTARCCLYNYETETHEAIVYNITSPALMQNQFTLLVYNGAPLDIEGLNFAIYHARLLFVDRFEKDLTMADHKLENLRESARVKNEVLEDISFVIHTELSKIIRNNPPEVLTIVSDYFMSSEEAIDNPYLRTLLVQGCRKKRDYTVPFHAVPTVSPKLCPLSNHSFPPSIPNGPKDNKE